MLKNRISNMEILKENLLSKEEKIRIVEYFGSILGLTQIPITIHYIIDVEEIPTYEKKGYLGVCGYNPKDKKYHIALTPESNYYTIIHELGHIYFERHLNRLYSKGKPRQYWNYEIYLFKNSIIDSFTNYHLFQFYQFGQIYLENVNNNWFISPKGDFKYILQFYIKTYLCYNFILRPEDKKELLDCNFNLKRTKSMLKRKGENIYKIPMKEKLDKLDNHLNYFDKIKDTKDYNQVRSFISKALKILNLWPQEELIKNLKLLK